MGKHRRFGFRFARVEELEPRVVLHAGHDHEAASGLLAKTSLPAIVQPLNENLQTAEFAAAGASLAVPAYSSLPGAAVSLYLDFNGHFDAVWGDYRNVSTPVFDVDGNRRGFGATELAMIRRIWEYVAEDFAPFNVNVTTVEPPSFADGVALRAAVGGSGSWLGEGIAGVAYVDSFTGPETNTVLVFADNIGYSKYIGETIAHEAGHGFGLEHQSRYSSRGSLIDEYYAGNGDGRAPIMGDSFDATRGLWWYGTSAVSSRTYQDDMSVIARARNGFGYRPDDHGNGASQATPLTIVGNQASATGIIANTADADYFSFTSGGGTITLTVTPPSGVGNLDARLELRDSTGGRIFAAADPAGTFGATITITVSAGSYRLVVASHGGYGDVGQYTVSGTIVPIVGLLPPTNLTARPNGVGRIDLTWEDQSADETGYIVERRQGAEAWAAVAQLAADATAYSDVDLAADTTYLYRVRCIDAKTASGYSNEARATAASGLVSVAAVQSAAETRSGEPARPAEFVVRRTGSTAAELTVRLTWSGTAIAGSDYSAPPESVVIAAGESSATIRVAPLDDWAAESAETVAVSLVPSGDYAIDTDRAAATATIDDNEPSVAVAATDAVAAEARKGVAADSGIFTLTRTGSLAEALTVRLQAGGTATGNDFRSIPKKLIFAAGQATATIVVAPRDDSRNEGNETVVLTIVADAKYSIADGGATAAMTIADNDFPVRPVNDQFAAAIALIGARAEAAGTNKNATRETGEPNPADRSGGKSVWWSWQATTSGTVVITTAGSRFDTTLGVYVGTSVDSLQFIAANDDENYARRVLTSRVSFTATAGETYRILVDGYHGATGAIKLAIA